MGTVRMQKSVSTRVDEVERKYGNYGIILN